MKQIIKEFITLAEEDKNIDLLSTVRDLVYTLSTTVNAPSNWRSIGEELAEEYANNEWVHEYMQLWEYEEDWLK